MNSCVLLDAGPVGLVTNPKRSVASIACFRWIQELVRHDVPVILPEIADYEVRRELIRSEKSQGLAELDRLASALDYLPITTAAMRQAAIFWAQARRLGQPTADDQSIDADVILAAQAATLGRLDTVIATTNVGHLSRFVPAELWQNIQAPSQ